MALDPVPWIVGGGAEHSPEVVRQSLFDSTGGAEGISSVGALKVSAQSTPNGTVRVAPGGAILNNRYAGGSGQSYSARNASQTSVSITATGSAGGRTDALILRILDPQYEGQPPADPNAFQYTRLVAVPAPAGITRIEQLNLTYPAILLARITIPANTGTITNAMITDLREVAIPRRESVLRTYAFTGGEGKVLGNTTAYPTGSTWAEEAPDAWGSIRIPSWATRVRLTMMWAGVGAPAGNAKGYVWVQIGLNSNTDKVVTQATRYDTASSGGWTRQVFVAADDRYINPGLRGTEQKIYPRANVDASVPTAARVQLDAGSSIILQAEFIEAAD